VRPAPISERCSRLVEDSALPLLGRSLLGV